MHQHLAMKYGVQTCETGVGDDVWLDKGEQSVVQYLRKHCRLEMCGPNFTLDLI